MAAIANDAVKYGIIGVGMMGREHLINLYHLRSENVAVVCIADPHVPSQQLALQLTQSFGWPIKVYMLFVFFLERKVYTQYACLVVVFVLFFFFSVNSKNS